MTSAERMAESLNRALRTLLDRDPCAYLIGEDIADPYGGAFKITRGLSDRHPDRVLVTPLSEGGIVGVAAGLALTGNKVVAEMMFADFVALAFDQLLNFASKSVSMYGRTIPLRMVVRCPSGGNRGYGPTHSQSLQKHFIGIPGLHLYEMSPFHDNTQLLEHMLGLGVPCVFFEDKVLYSRPLRTRGVVDGLFRCDFLPGGGTTAHVVTVEAPDPDWVIIAPGGLAERAMNAIRSLLLEDELTCELLVPSRLYPVDIGPLLPVLSRARGICVVEDGPVGGTWGELIAQLIHTRLWGRLGGPVLLLSARLSIVPAAAHLEREVIVQETTIHRAVAEATK